MRLFGIGSPAKKQLPPGLKQRGDKVFEGGQTSDVIIPIMGQTGAGKSTFINALLGTQRMEVGESLRSCTKEIAWEVVDPCIVAPLCPALAKRRVIIVDTPGFDDTMESDATILRRISVWLASSYCQEMKLGGILYLHSIAMNRMSGTALRNLNTFQKLCGKDPLKRVILATTMWQVGGEEDKEKREKRERELKDEPDFWKGMIQGGSTTQRFILYDTPTEKKEAAGAILGILLRRFLAHESEGILAIQRELVDMQQDIRSTAAGKLLHSELLRMVEEEQYASELGDAEKKKELKKRIKKLERQVRELDNNALTGLFGRIRCFFA